jgi:hypothetical protein
MKYEFELKNEKTTTYRLIRRLLVVLNMLALCYLVVMAPKDFTHLLWPGLSILMSLVYFGFVAAERIYKKPMPELLHRPLFLCSAVAWGKFEFWLIALALIGFVVLDYFAHRRLLIIVTEDFIQLPVVPRRKIEWSELHQVVLKDGILTVDFKNNKLFQHGISDADLDTSEQEFNRFCKQQISKAPPSAAR